MSECEYCIEVGWEQGWFSLALQQESLCAGWRLTVSLSCPDPERWLQPCFGSDGEDEGTELWMFLGLSVKGTQCVAGPPGRGAPIMRGARGP